MPAIWNLVPLLYLSMLEASVGILVLCTPSVKLFTARGIHHLDLTTPLTTKHIGQH
ncbi:hypothetical protein F4775DRAFT_563260 [Biscogniauxia sp. FL1348]|nr:hypothetical protein F4775DRAFT_563260 [Biscogniauxia sp. FL1348]